MDTSAILQSRRQVPVAVCPRTLASLSDLVTVGRLKFPSEVLKELRRHARPDAPDQLLEWAESVEGNASADAPSLDRVKDVLAVVADILDKDKDSGAEEADPYVLAFAVSLREQAVDARVVTQEVKDSPRKMSLNTAAGILGIPSVPLGGLLRAEQIPQG